MQVSKGLPECGNKFEKYRALYAWSKITIRSGYVGLVAQYGGYKCKLI